MEATYRLYRKHFLLSVLFACILFLSSCGNDEGAYGASGHGTGELFFDVVYHSAAGKLHPQAAAINCAGEGIATVEAAVYDPNDVLFKSGGPWECDAGQGTIGSVPSGIGRTIVILGKSSANSVVFRGQKSNIQVEADSENDVGTIDCYAFVPGLRAPVDGAVVNADVMGLAWNTVAGAKAYHIRVSENNDLSDPMVDESAPFENYVPAILSNGHTYYWQVIAADVYKNSGIGSPIGSFSADAQHQNAPPVAQMTTPDEGSTFTIEDSITFTGSGNDDKDDEHRGLFLSWRSSVDGSIGEGETFDSDAFSEGTHQITLEGLICICCRMIPWT